MVDREAQIVWRDEFFAHAIRRALTHGDCLIETYDEVFRWASSMAKIAEQFLDDEDNLDEELLGA